MSRAFYPLIALAMLLGGLGSVGAAPDSNNPLGDLFQGLSENPGAQEFLAPDEAFKLSVSPAGSNRVLARWDIAEGYYLYKDKYRFDLAGPRDGRVQKVELPAGYMKNDPEFGEVEVHTGQVEARIDLIPVTAGTREVTLKLGYQGCADEGICYPPMQKTLSVALPAGTAGTAGAAGTTPVPVAESGAASLLAEEDHIARELQSHGVAWALLQSLGFGLLLAFTPCVFPMVPILSGIIAGQGVQVSTRRAVVLSAVFVLTMALAYAGMGIVAALLGRNLQATFQHPGVLITFAGLFVVLALSMFGIFKLELPPAWQTRLYALGAAQRGGTLHGVAVMGLLSALIVGPCVAPPLAAALIVIGKNGDVVLGGSALFAMGLGMGLPLLLVGASAGHWLPKAGVWMEQVKTLFGVLFLGVALWLLERILPGPLSVLLWGLLFMTAAVGLGALDPLDAVSSGSRRVTKGLGLAAFLYGAVLIVGAAGGSSDIFQPLARYGTVGAGAPAASARPQFEVVKGSDALKRSLSLAQSRGLPALVDLYADWCVECKEIERRTFSEPAVRRALAGVVLIKADVTATDEEDRRLLNELELYGPPALLFYGVDGAEQRHLRALGFVGPEALMQRLAEVSS
ncbi:MAG: protein-disulfide reductase DsbD [Gammaproteobacteria bacterium]